MPDNNKTTSPNSGGSVDTGLHCLVMLARFHHLMASAEQLAHEFIGHEGVFGASELLLAARHIGLKAKWLRHQQTRLSHLPLPALAMDRHGGFFIIARFDNGQVLIQDPVDPQPQVISQEQLAARWTGELLLLQSQAQAADDRGRFDFTWFIPAIVKYRSEGGNR